jgi:hypothetical protein
MVMMLKNDLVQLGNSDRKYNNKHFRPLNQTKIIVLQIYVQLHYTLHSKC